MKRDVDLCRQLLFDLEAHGPDCTVNVLRNGAATDADDRVRFHMRLLIDAGFAKEVDRTSGGMACVRLTHAGFESLELFRSDSRWRDAKAVVLEQTGGLSLTIVRTLLTKWAVEAVSRGESPRSRRAYRPYYRRVEPRPSYENYRPEIYRERAFRDGRDYLLDNEDIRLVRSNSVYGERSEYVVDGPIDGPINGSPVDTLDAGGGVSLPVYLV